MHATAASSGGGTNTETLIRAAHLVLADVGTTMTPSRVSRLVRDYQRRAPQGFSFFRYLAGAIEVSEDRALRAAARNPVLARTITGYLDPTGETAVNNITERDG